MFIALLINLILCFYHIMIHSLFKSILSLLAGCLGYSIEMLNSIPQYNNSSSIMNRKLSKSIMLFNEKYYTIWCNSYN